MTYEEIKKEVRRWRSELGVDCPTIPRSALGDACNIIERQCAEIVQLQAELSRLRKIEESLMNWTNHCVSSGRISDLPMLHAILDGDSPKGGEEK